MLSNNPLFQFSRVCRLLARQGFNRRRVPRNRPQESYPSLDGRQHDIYDSGSQVIQRHSSWCQSSRWLQECIRKVCIWLRPYFLRVSFRHFRFLFLTNCYYFPPNRSQNDVLTAVKRASVAQKTKKVTVIGHSLGGAIATLSAASMRSLLGPSWYFKVVTYGGPRVCQFLLPLFHLTHRVLRLETLNGSDMSMSVSQTFHASSTRWVGVHDNLLPFILANSCSLIPIIYLAWSYSHCPRSILQICG